MKSLSVAGEKRSTGKKKWMRDGRNCDVKK